MYGTVKELCAGLLDEYPAGEKITLIVWSEANVRNYAEDMVLTYSEAAEVVRQIDCEDGLYEYGIGMTTIQEMVNNIREQQEQSRQATVPAGALAKALRLAAEFLRLADTEGGEGAAARLYPAETAALAQVRKALDS